MCNIAWVDDPLVLIWPPQNILRISPFEPNMTAAERLNAHTRLIILLGLLFIRSENNLPILLVVILWVLNQGVTYVISQKELYPAVKKMSTVPPPIPTPTPRVMVPSGDPSVETATSLISQDQQQYKSINHHLTRYPTLFDVQNQRLPIGGRAPALTTSYQVQPDQGRIHPNPGPFDYGQAVHSLNPKAYTYQRNQVEKMMRPVDEVDPNLVTQPIPDPTFMARMPTFDKTNEYMAEQRWRMQQGSGMRFW